MSVDKAKFSETLKSMGAIGPFVEQEVLKGREALDYVEIPPGDGEDAQQVYIITKHKIIWVYSNPQDGFMQYKTYLLRNLLEYEYGKIPAPTPDLVAKRALLRIRFMGNSEIGIEAVAESPESASERHKRIVSGIDAVERQLRKLTQPSQNANSSQEYEAKKGAQ
jgi:hypothetical protein